MKTLSLMMGVLTHVLNTWQHKVPAITPTKTWGRRTCEEKYVQTGSFRRDVTVQEKGGRRAIGRFPRDLKSFGVTNYGSCEVLHLRLSCTLAQASKRITDVGWTSFGFVTRVVREIPSQAELRDLPAPPALEWDAR